MLGQLAIGRKQRRCFLTATVLFDFSVYKIGFLNYGWEIAQTVTMKKHLPKFTKLMSTNYEVFCKFYLKELDVTKIANDEISDHFKAHCTTYSAQFANIRI